MLMCVRVCIRVRVVSAHQNTTVKWDQSLDWDDHTWQLLQDASDRSHRGPGGALMHKILLPHVMPLSGPT